MKLDIKSVVKESFRKAFFTPKHLLVETMDVYIKGANYERLDTLGPLSWKLAGPIWRYTEILPQDQLAYFQKNRAPIILTPDGNDYFKPTGTLNFYTAGFTKQSIRFALKSIFTSLKQLGFAWGKTRREQSATYNSQVIRIPILTNPHIGKYRGPPPLNFSNVNAYQIFHNVLQYPGEHEFHMKAKELMERIESLTHDKSWIDKNKINPTDSNLGNKPFDNPDIENPHLDVVNQIGKELGNSTRIIGGGLSADDIRKRVGLIWDVAKWADDHGFEDIYVA